MSELSGRKWVDQFPTSTSISDLAVPFQNSVQRFYDALQAAGATVSISATLRPPERAYLMHYAYRIAKEHLDPATVPAMAGVDIDWVHTNARGNTDLVASRRAASEMVTAYNIVHRPALKSQHTKGLAIDMDISWTGNLVITDGYGKEQTLKDLPRTGAGNTSLRKVGASFGVHKLTTDAPHWSSDGH